MLVHLQEDVTNEEVVLFSIPGKLEGAEWMAGRTTPWKRIRPSPLCQDGSSVLAVSPDTFEVILIEVWPRAALDSVALGNTLTRHLRRHERWRTVLAGRPTGLSDGDCVRQGSEIGLSFRA
jgi:hypothetical protein